MVKSRAPAKYFTQSGTADSDDGAGDADSDGEDNVSSSGSMVKALTALQAL